MESAGPASDTWQMVFGSHAFQPEVQVTDRGIRGSGVIHATSTAQPDTPSVTEHYHLLVETQKPTLSRGRREMNGVCTQGFNGCHGRLDHMLQSRDATSR
jgi:hypothetical protein